MKNYSSKVGEIKVKVQKLVYLHRDLTRKNASLLEENSRLKSQIDQHNQTLKEMNEKIKILMLSKSISGSAEETQALRLKINGLIREVDKCISLLNA